MMKSVLLVLVAALFVCGVVSQPGTTNITSFRASGFDVIVLDSPSWVTHIQASWGEHEFFVFGETTQRTINTGMGADTFYAQAITDFWQYPLIDLSTFYLNDSSNNMWEWTLGLSDYTPVNAQKFQQSFGPYVPLFSTARKFGSPNSAPIVQAGAAPGVFDYTGFLNYAIKVNGFSYANNSFDVYLAGFVINPDNILDTAFSLTVASYIPFADGLYKIGDRQFNTQPGMVFPLYSNNFTAFSNVYKPWIHYLPNWGPNAHTLAIVADPNTQSVWGVDVDVPISNTTTFSPSVSWLPNNAYEVVSATFMPPQLILGLAASGFQPGAIAVFTFDNSSMSVPQAVIYPLPQNYSNPKAISADFDNLYIGMNGYPEVLRMSLSNFSVTGYQRLPEYLHRSWAAQVTRDHVYFVTYEQNSKVFRVSKNDFCPKTCPYMGFCKGGSCVCDYGFEMTSDKTMCLLQAAQDVITIKHHYIKAHDGEVALGVLFALTFIAAAAGWGMWYRGRSHAYHSV